MKSEQHFRITYDGPALQAHQMDVRDLAPAMLAMADLLKAANSELFGDKAEVRIAVNASFKVGSFGIDLVFFQDILTQITELFSGKEASAASNAIQILQAIGVLGGGGVLAFLRWQKRRKIESAEIRGDRVIIAIAEEHTEIDLATWKLVQNRRVRLELQNVLKPLESEEVDTFATGTEHEISALVEREVREYFYAPPDSDSPLSDSITPSVVLQIESAVFKEANKWRFTDGARSFHAAIEDAKFLARVEAGIERFGKNDILIVDLRQLQYAINGELKSEYQIVLVREHREPLQKPLI